MNKTIKSDVRKLLYTMMNKFEEKQKEKQDPFDKKQQCLLAITRFIDNLDVKESSIKDTIKTLATLEEEELIKTKSQYLEEISSLTGVSVATLKRIKKEGQVNDGIFRTPGKKRPRKPTVSNLDSFDINAIRNKINEFYLVKKQVPTLRSLLNDLRESIGFTGSRETLRQILHDNGYEFKRNKNERSLLIERFDLAAWRHKFLRTISSKRAEGKPVIYVDETYVHQNYKPKKSWQGPSTSGVVEKISPGKRYIIVHAGSEKGFVPNALLLYSTKSKMADYHHDMNAQNFNKWLVEKLIPNLPEPSVIVMDNASYHTVQVNKSPTTQNVKSKIQQWLTENNIGFENHFTKAELLCLVQKHKPEPIYEADQLLEQHGHEVLRLPPYHCDLNPIELIWSLVKRKNASKNINLPSPEVERIIRESFECVTPQDWKKKTDHIVHLENTYKERDKITDEAMDRFIINVCDDSSNSDSSLEVEFLDSDFDFDS